jgi:phytoene/squalene synthetase
MQLSHCAALTREHDHDRYLCALFAPPPAREAWFALFAFNHEIASIPERVSEEMIGFVRFAWWREALDEIYAGAAVRRHPVAEALAKAVTGHALPRAPLDAMLEAREARIGGKAFADAREWEPYFMATSSSLLMLCAAVAGAETTPAVDALGMAWAYVGTARGAALAGETENAQALADAGAAHLEHAREGLPACFSPFATTAGFYLKRLKAGKTTGREAALPLTFTLCCRRLFGG